MRTGFGTGDILLTDRRRIHHHIRSVHFIGPVRRGKNKSQTLHALGFPTRHHVRAADMMTHAQQKQGQATHARARHTHQVDAQRALAVGQAFA